MPFRISANSDAKIPGITKVFFNMLGMEEELGRRDEFRVSGFPYCPVIDATEDKTQIEQFGMDYYTEVGTAVHNVVQHYLGKHPVARGCWSCNYCKIVHDSDPPSPKAFNVKPTSRPKDGIRCVECKKFPKWKYEEVQFDYKGLSGHMDFLFRFAKKNIVIDFKTTGNKYIENDYMSKFLPMDKHPHQIKTYCALLWLQYGIRVDYYILVYLARDKPYEREPSKAKKRFGTLVIKHFTDKMLEQQIAKIEKAIKGRKAVVTGNVKRIMKHKPCGSANEYMRNGMNDKWFGKETCPFYANKSCFKPDRLKKLLMKNVNKPVP